MAQASALRAHPETGDRSRKPDLLLSDRALSADKDADFPDVLGLGPYADALAYLMDARATNTPLTVAVSGPWGSGKTSLARMTEARLSIGSDWNAPHIVCWFDAWANDDAPHLGPAFAAAVALTVSGQRRWWYRLFQPLPSAMLSPDQRWRRRVVLGFLAALLAAAAVFLPSGQALFRPVLHLSTATSGLGSWKSVWTRLGISGLAVLFVAVTRSIIPGVRAAARWIDDPRSESARGSMAEASKQLGRFIDQGLRGRRRLMIFVDNLDRCRPPRALDVCEAVTKLVGQTDVITVLLGDMDVIAASAEIKYAPLEEIPSPLAGGGPAAGSFGRRYLEKLVQIQITLPPPTRKSIQGMFNIQTGERPPAFPSLPASEKRRLVTFLAARARSAQDVAFSGSNPRAIALITAAFLFLGIPLVAFDAFASPELVGSALVLAFLGKIIGESNSRRRRQSERSRIDEAVEEIVRSDVTSIADSDVALVKKAIEKPDPGTIIIQSRIRRRIVSGSRLRKELDREIIKDMPESPRAAKRMFNQAHLLLDIGVGRGVFESRKVTACHLAEWVTLTERWPSVAAGITRQPELLGKLERVARRISFASLNGDATPIQKLEIAAQRILSGSDCEHLGALQDKVGLAPLEGDLLAYVHKYQSLAKVIRVLVNFAPAADVDVSG